MSTGYKQVLVIAIKFVFKDNSSAVYSDAKLNEANSFSGDEIKIFLV